MITNVSDDLIREIAKDIFNEKLNMIQIKCVRLMARTGELKRMFCSLPKDKQEKIKEKYGTLVAQL